MAANKHDKKSPDKRSGNGTKRKKGVKNAKTPYRKYYGQ